MSQPQDDRDSIVTKEYLEEYLAQVIDLIEKRQKGQFESLLTAINTSIDEKLDPLFGRVNQLTAYVNQGGSGGQPEQPQTTRKQTLNELLNNPLIDQFMPVIKERLGLRESADPAVEEFRQNTQKLTALIYRKAALLTSKMFEQGMKSAMKEEFTTTAARDMVQSAVSDHQPL